MERHTVMPPASNCWLTSLINTAQCWIFASEALLKPQSPVSVAIFGGGEELNLKPASNRYLTGLTKHSLAFLGFVCEALLKPASNSWPHMLQRWGNVVWARRGCAASKCVLRALRFHFVTKRGSPCCARPRFSLRDLH